MPGAADYNLSYDRPIEIADGVYWVGFFDPQTGLHCNPYLIVDCDEAVVIDGGSRPDFPTVMMKILQTGITPSVIAALVYQHYDPDLCGSVSNFEDMIDRSDLKIISADASNMFIRHYSISSNLVAIETLDGGFEFTSGRRLEFIHTPYAHSAGSFVTFDHKSKVLFTSDLFGSLSKEWELFLRLGPKCKDCINYEKCLEDRSYCPLPDILTFHRQIMPTQKALRFALKRMEKIPYAIIAPQHGSVIHEIEDAKLISKRLAELDGVGIDGID